MGVGVGVGAVAVAAAAIVVAVVAAVAAVAAAAAVGSSSSSSSSTKHSAQLCPTSGTLFCLTSLRRCHGMQTPSLSLQGYSASTLVCTVVKPSRGISARNPQAFDLRPAPRLPTGNVHGVVDVRPKHVGMKISRGRPTLSAPVPFVCHPMGAASCQPQGSRCIHTGAHLPGARCIRTGSTFTGARRPG